MRKITVFLFLICLFNLSFYIPVSAQNTKFQPSEKAYKWADKQLKKMSADEKVGQTRSHRHQRAIFESGQLRIQGIAAANR